MQPSVMKAAERDQVAQISAAALRPVLQVVSVRPPPRHRAGKQQPLSRALGGSASGQRFRRRSWSARVWTGRR